MKHRILILLFAAAILAATATAQAGWRHRCAAYCGMYAGGCEYSPCVDYQPCQPVYRTVQRVVMVPTMSSELRTIQVTECRYEQRERTYTAYRQVPEYHQVSYEYTACVPRAATRTVNYTVAKPVMTTAERQYTVMVPYTEMRQGTRPVCTMVPETRTRTICVDQGHWEDVVAPCTTCAPNCTTSTTTPSTTTPAAAASEPLVVKKESKFQTVGWRHRYAAGYYGGYGGGCASDCATACCAPPVCAPQRRWVPNLVTQQVQYTCMRQQIDYVAYEYPVTLCRPETRTRTVKLCNYVQEQRSRQVSYTEYVPERRVGTRQVCTYRSVPEQRTCIYSVSVPYTVEKQISVPVCKMVPQTITCQVLVPSSNCCDF